MGEASFFKFMLILSHLPEIGEPFDELGRVVLVELDVWEVHLEHGRRRISHPEEHQLGFPQMHRSQRRRVHSG